MSTDSTTKPAAPLACTNCGDTAGPLDLATGHCEDCTDAFPYRGGHDNPCAYAAGISSNCTCGGAA